MSKKKEDEESATQEESPSEALPPEFVALQERVGALEDRVEHLIDALEKHSEVLPDLEAKMTEVALRVHQTGG